MRERTSAQRTEDLVQLSRVEPVPVSPSLTHHEPPPVRLDAHHHPLLVIKPLPSLPPKTRLRDSQRSPPLVRLEERAEDQRACFFGDECRGRGRGRVE